MKKLLNLFKSSCLLLLLFACQQIEFVDPNESMGQPMKTVTISAGIHDLGTKASIDSQTGAFTWQSGDLISVLATDGRFYDFILTSGTGEKKAEFNGSIPESAEITTVATYPRIVENGTENTVLTENTLNYILPESWTYAPEVSNVPMIAVFGVGAEHMDFKQIGGVMRFPVKNLPKEASFVVTMNDKTITGKFPVDITAVGETAMTAGNAASVLTINYSSDIDGGSAEFNVPVPVGVYNNFNVTVKDAKGNDLFSKDYSADNTVNRRTLLRMKELVLPERPVAISEVWPFYVDARVMIGKSVGVTKYAFYIDGADEPVIKEVEDWDEMVGALVGGNFGHNTTHTVAVAKVIDDKPVLATKSETVSFTTADIRQLTTNTGTKFVSVGWDDVAIAGGPKYVDGKWTIVSSANYPDLDEKGRKLHQTRGYKVQLLAADKTTVIYEMIPFDGHSIHQNAYYDSAAIGKVDGNNVLNPTAITFGYLESGKDYYFRVKTLDGIEEIDFAKGDYIAPDNDGKPYPYPISSARGGSAWSDFIKVSTDAAHVPSATEVLYESFDDIMVGPDYMNWSVAVNPDMETSKRQGWDDYIKDTPVGYPAFLNLEEGNRKWTTHAFNKLFRADNLGWFNGGYVANINNVLNSNAGSFAGWSLKTSKIDRNIYPLFGAIAIGQGITSHGGSMICTPALNSDILLSESATKCKVTVKVAYMTQDRARVSRTVHVYNTRTSTEKIVLDVAETYPEEWAEVEDRLVENNTKDFKSSNYAHYQRYYELECEMSLIKGDVIAFEKITGSGSDANQTKEYGFLIIGEIKIEADPNEVETPTFNDNGVGTEPNDTNYDVYGLGEFPISYWYSPPTAAHNYDDAKTREIYKTMAESGINTVLYYGELDYSLEENLRIMGVAEDLGMKFIGSLHDPVRFPTNSEKIAAIKQYLAPSDTYVGEYMSDEPSTALFDDLGSFTREYLKEIPNKEVYINLFPDYASPTQLGATNYEQYIDRYIEKVPTKSLSYDYYGLASSEAVNVRGSYFLNLDLLREKSLAVNKPFWVITQAGKVGGSTRVPTELDQRWTVWSSIAGGSKGISYFCYWLPIIPDENGDPNPAYDSAMINRDGTKREMYDWVKDINSDIKTIGKKLLPCHADGFILSSKGSYFVYANGGLGRTKYGPITAVTGNPYALCGCFRDARTSMSGDNYKGYKVLVMPQMPGTMAYAYLELVDSVTAITVTHNNTTQTLQLANDLDVNVGDIRVRFDGAKLSLTIPEGEAALIEF